MKQIATLMTELYAARPELKHKPIEAQLLHLKRRMIAEGYSDDKIRSTLVRIYGHKVLVEAKLSVDFLKAIGDKKAIDAFIANLPGGHIHDAVIDVLNKFTPDEVAEFKKLLASKSKPESMPIPTSGVGKKLMAIEVKGIGRGEVFLAVLIAGAKIQGGNESFDLLVGSSKYEVKDYSEKQSGKEIRAGVESKVTQFRFWRQLLKTIEVLRSIEKKNGWDLIPDGPDKKTFIAKKDYILDRVDKQLKIESGEFNKTDYQYVESLYFFANRLIQTETTGKAYNQVTFTGPGEQPRYFDIQPVTTDKIGGGRKLNLTLLQGDLTGNKVLNWLGSLDYVRDPKSFKKDIDDAIRQIIENGTADAWIIFRSGKIKVIPAKAENFHYSVISQGGVKFREME